MMVGPPNSAFFLDLRQDSQRTRKREQHSSNSMALVIGYHKIRGLGAPLRMICYYKSQPFTNVSRSHSTGAPRIFSLGGGA